MALERLEQEEREHDTPNTSPGQPNDDARDADRGYPFLAELEEVSRLTNVGTVLGEELLRQTGMLGLTERATEHGVTRYRLTEKGIEVMAMDAAGRLDYMNGQTFLTEEGGDWRSTSFVLWQSGVGEPPGLEGMQHSIAASDDSPTHPSSFEQSEG